MYANRHRDKAEEKAKAAQLENAVLRIELRETQQKLRWVSAAARVEAGGRQQAERAYVALRTQVLARRHCLPARVKRARDNAECNVRVRRGSPWSLPPAPKRRKL